MSNSDSSSRKPNIILLSLALLAILAAAASLRFVGFDWDENQHLHPDERFLTDVSSHLQPVDTLQQYFDTTTSTLNPNNVSDRFGLYVYGDLPLIITRYIAEPLGKTDYFSIHFVGRAVSAVGDLLVVLLIFLTARRLFDWRVGLLSALLYAFAALPIQQSHFFTVDPTTNLFVAASLYFASRLQDRHNWADIIVFGVALGFAMASKISAAPLALVLIAAIAIRSVRQASNHSNTQALNRVLLINGISLVVAGLLTIVAFRAAMPYAFLPPGTDIPINEEELGAPLALMSKLGDPVGFRPNPAWINQMRTAKHLVSGNADMPPNHQWAHRAKWLFPLGNIVRVGLGWPLGVTAWMSVAWAAWEIIRRNPRFERLFIPLIWIMVYFGWQGSGWVTTMRYFLVIYGSLVMLSAWALITIWDRIQRLLARRRVERWSWPSYVSLALLVVITTSTIIWGFSVSRIYTRQHTRVAASRWITENIPADVTLLIDTPEGQRQVQVGLANNWPPLAEFDTNLDAPGVQEDPTQPALQYTYLVPAGSDSFTYILPNGLPQTIWGAYRETSFTMPISGTLTAIRLNRVSDPLDINLEQTLDIAIRGEAVGEVASGSVTDDFSTGGATPGQRYTIDVDDVVLNQGQELTLTATPDETGPLVLAGATLSWEGDWDDPVPLNLDGYNPWGAMYQGYKLQMAWEDTPEKRERLTHILDRTDFIIITSNRFYDTLNRNPVRWPMTLDYYQSLFTGSLGFELVGDFASRPAFGSLEFIDDNAEEAWTVYDHPRVFIFRKTSSYSHDATVEILNGADLVNITRAIAPDALGKPIRQPLPPPRPSGEPVQGVTDLGAGQDWTQYDPTPKDLYSRFQGFAVIVWWLLIAVIGWAVFPILWAVLPGLPDRAYAVSRIAGMLIIAWSGWMLSSLKILPWSGWLGTGALVLFASVSALIVYRKRREFMNWLRNNRQHLVIVEATLLLLYLAFVLVRLGNPDLWHVQFGGEKPMDLAYLNAIMRAKTFPPYNPWFAGETINYYYFGFVIISMPVKMLGMPVSLAYNLVIPTLFAVTGIGAFSAAYNLVATPQAGRQSRPDEKDLVFRPPTFWQVLRRWPNLTLDDLLDSVGNPSLPGSDKKRQPYIAGYAALLLAVVLGNLDQIRTLIWGLAKLGVGAPLWTFKYFPPLSTVVKGFNIVVRDGQPLSTIGLGEWYWNATRVIPVPINAAGQVTEQVPITEFPFFTFLYADLHAHMIALPLTLLVLVWAIALIRGATAKQSAGTSVASGFIGALAIGALRPTNTWDWPTYLLLGMVTVVIAHFSSRKSQRSIVALLVGGLTGMTLAVFAAAFLVNADPVNPGALNIPFIGIGLVVGLLAGYGLSLGLISPADEGKLQDALYDWTTLFAGGIKALGLALGTIVLYLPYIQNYEAGYEKIIPWTGSRTPAWAFYDILGIFVFVLLTWLLWETARWLDGKVTRRHIFVGLFAISAIIAVMVFASQQISPVTIFTAPMLILCVALFAKSDQQAEKRFVLLIIMCASALAVVVEVVVLQGDLSRMNTVFKFYLQIWVLLAVAAGAAFGWLIPYLRRSNDIFRSAWSGVLALMVIMALTYTITASRAKMTDRWERNAPHTLDGLASFMPYWQTYGEHGSWFSLEPDYEAIRWLQDNVKGNPVLLEGLSTIEYQYGNRVSIYTGLPSVIGWNWHQRQQQPPLAMEVTTRHIDVATIYNTPSTDTALELLEKYDVELIFVGGLEHAYYDDIGLTKFDWLVERGMLKVLYARNNTVIYQVIGD